MRTHDQGLIAGFIITACLTPSNVIAPNQNMPSSSPFLSFYYDKNEVIFSQRNEVRYLTSDEQTIVSNALFRSVTVDYDII
jgi:hypothetical protein